MLGELAAFGSSVTWAIGTQVYPGLSEQHSPFQVNGSRALVALPLFLFLSLWLDGQAGWSLVGSHHAGWMLLSMVSSYFLGDACFLWSTRALGIPGALAVASSYPVWTALAGWGIKGQALLPQQVLGIILAVGGTTLVILSGYAPAARRGSQGARYGVGVLFGILTSGFWALNSWAVAEGGAGISPWIGNTLRMAIALVLCAGTSTLLARRLMVGLPSRALRPHIAIFAFEAFGGSLFFLYGLTHTSLAVAAALSSLAPVISVPIAWARRTESVSWRKAFGIGLAVCGAVILLTAKAIR